MKNKVREVLVDLSKKNSALRYLLRKGILLKQRSTYLKYRNNPVDDKLVVFEAFMGRKYADSPKAIYEYMLSDNKFADFRFVWFFKNCEEYSHIAENERTEIIKYGSAEYYKCYAEAKYWVTNSRIPDSILKKDEQVYIQCWHGTPLKKLGFDIDVKGGNAMNSIKDIRYKYKVDSQKYSYMISPSAFCTEKFTSAFALKSVNNEDILIETGYPRNDFLINFNDNDIKRIKNELNIPEDKKVVLYAPTWRDDQHKSGLGYTYENEVDFDSLREKLGDEYVILFRAHYFVANKFDFGRYEGFVYNVSEMDDINELYIIADLLITDYSSVFFDYANLKRPIVFYMYDLENYRDEIRGFYLNLEDLPGPIVTTEDALIKEIENCKTWEMDEKYKAFTSKFNYLDDGHASERVAKICILGDE